MQNLFLQIFFEEYAGVWETKRETGLPCAHQWPTSWSWASPKPAPGVRSIIWVFHLSTLPQGLESPFTALPDTSASSWIWSKVAGAQSNIHVGYWHCRLKLHPLCHKCYRSQIYIIIFSYFFSAGLVRFICDHLGPTYFQKAFNLSKSVSHTCY